MEFRKEVWARYINVGIINIDTYIHTYIHTKRYMKFEALGLNKIPKEKVQNERRQLRTELRASLTS